MSDMNCEWLNDDEREKYEDALAFGYSTDDAMDYAEGIEGNVPERDLALDPQCDWRVVARKMREVTA